MKRILTFAAAGLIAVSLVQPVHAGVFGTAGTLRPGNFSIGLEPQIFFSPSDILFWVHGGIGLTSGMDLDLKLGLGNDTIFGADIEFMLIPDRKRGVGLSFAAGAHGSNNLGLDATLLLSNKFRTFSLYGALDSDIEFVNMGDTDNDGDDETEIWVPTYLTIGVLVPVARQMEFLLEGNIAVTDSASSNLAGGVVFYF